ncbi:sugar ABC transporter permease [Bacillus timonensis]|uniref:Sugar ABC transporter permease n=1 Tax=Bacillus timonensis TaxID=1033734 RepID=A0A4S3PW26_9BACI|nr:sugar ABC transporter permease [Bacillus timonensis]THE13685.1 sugar ABC transporter permease [Bacillus timonensis]
MVKPPLKKKIKDEWRKNGLVYLVLTPVLIHFLIFQVIPFVYSFILTFLNYRIIGTSEFVGLRNWKQLFQDEIALKSIWNTILFSFYYILPTMALGLILALVIKSGIRFTKFFKGIFFLPVVTSFVVVAGIWEWLFSGTESGLINYLISFLGIEPQLFLSDSSQALLVLAGLSIFKVSGSTMIYYFAGLQSIPKDMYEAAKIDGASPLKSFWLITFPLLKPIHFYVLIITTIGSFQIFDSAFLLTNGGPNFSTSTIVFYLYQIGFTNLNFSYAAVLSYVLFAIILIISLIQRKYFGKDQGIY